MSSMNLATNVPLYPQQLTQSWVDQLPWFAVQTRPRFEKKSRRNCARRVSKHSCLCSLRSAVERSTEDGGYATVPRIRFSASHGRSECARRSSSNHRRHLVVGVRGIGTPIPNEEISAIQRLLNEKIPFESHPFLQIGQQVRIRGAVSTVSREFSQRFGDQSLVVSVELVQRSIPCVFRDFRSSLFNCRDGVDRRTRLSRSCTWAAVVA